MKAILMSIRPQWVAKILNGEKTIEIRKRFPKDYVGWVYIYVTKALPQLSKTYANDYEIYDDTEWDKEWIDLNGKVVARFWCDKVEEHRPFFHWCIEKETCLTRDNVLDYLDSKDKSVGNPKRQGKVYAIHITKLEIFDKPKEISEFYLAFSYKGEKPFINAQTNSLVHRVEINGKIEYESVSHLTRAPQSYMFIEV